MATPANDPRSTSRRALDDEIIAEPMLPPPDLAAEAVPLPLEAFLPPPRRPLAVAGVVENGMIRPLDPGVTLIEHSRVIIVTAER